MARPHGYRTVTQLARYCGVSVDRVKKWHRNGLIPPPELILRGVKLWSTPQARDILEWHSKRDVDRTELPPTALMRRGKDPQR